MRHTADIMELEAKMAEACGLLPHNVFCAAGREDIIYRLIYAVRPGRIMTIANDDEALMRAAQAYGCEMIIYDTADELIGDITDDCGLVYVYSHSISGKAISSDAFAEIAEKCRNTGIRMVIDEISIGFCDCSRFCAMGAAVIRSCSDFYGIPFPEFFLCTDDELICRMKICGPSEMYLSFSADECCKALDDDEYVSRTLRYIAREREYLTECLGNLPVTVLPSDCSYIMTETELPLEDILTDGRIRRCGRYYRIDIKSHEENVSLVYALSKAVFRFIKLKT